jgi:hypothetical protein
LYNGLVLLVFLSFHDVHLTDGLQVPGVRQRAGLDKLEAARGGEIGDRLLGRILIARHKHLHG